MSMSYEAFGELCEQQGVVLVDGFEPRPHVDVSKRTLLHPCPTGLLLAIREGCYYRRNGVDLLDKAGNKHFDVSVLPDDDVAARAFAETLNGSAGAPHDPSIPSLQLGRRLSASACFGAERAIADGVLDILHDKDPSMQVFTDDSGRPAMVSGPFYQNLGLSLDALHVGQWTPPGTLIAYTKSRSEGEVTEPRPLSDIRYAAPIRLAAFALTPEHRQEDFSAAINHLRKGSTEQATALSTVSMPTIRSLVEISMG